MGQLTHVQDLLLPATGLSPQAPVLLVRSPDGRGLYVVAWDAQGTAQSVLSYGCVFLLWKGGDTR